MADIPNLGRVLGNQTTTPRFVRAIPTSQFGEHEMILPNFLGRSMLDPLSGFCTASLVRRGTASHNTALLSYRALETNAQHNREWQEKDRKVKVRSMIRSGYHNFIAAEAEGMANKMFENVKHGAVKDWTLSSGRESPRLSEKSTRFCRGID